MIGIIIVAHGKLGESLIECATHILGHTPQHCIALSIQSNDDLTQLLPRLKNSIASVDNGHGILLLTDIFGATPSNVIQSFLVSGKIEAVAGVSLPMLLRTINYQAQPLPVIVEKAVSGGKDGVIQLNGKLN